jgi:adenine-specific DNA-methyltransferase
MELNTFKSFLGTPVYEDKDILIYQGDSLLLMNKLPAECLPLTVTSPPYNIGKEYESTLSLEDYLQWTAKWINQVYYCTSSHGAFWLNLGYLSIPNSAKAIPI